MFIGKNEKGERKIGGKLHKKREEGLKNVSFRVINSKKITPPAATLFVGGEINLKRGGGGGEWSKCTIYTPGCVSIAF